MTDWLTLLSIPTIYLTFSFLFGLLIGSFINVICHRLPIMLERSFTKECHEFLSQSVPALCNERFNLAVPRSGCPQCHSLIAWFDNIPVLSYIALRGKCRVCQNPIHWRYPVIELITALLTLLVVWHFGFQLKTLFALVLTWNLIALTVIDFQHMIIPDEQSLPFIWIGLLINMGAFFCPLPTAVIGAIAGYMSLWSVFWTFKLLTGKEGMGQGDFKLMAVFGAWLGWQQLPFIIFGSAILGSVFGGILIATGRSKDTPFAFGPFIAIAGFIAMLWGSQIIHWYWGLY